MARIPVYRLHVDFMIAHPNRDRVSDKVMLEWLKKVLDNWGLDYARYYTDYDGYFAKLMEQQEFQQYKQSDTFKKYASRYQRYMKKHDMDEDDLLYEMFDVPPVAIRSTHPNLSP